MFKRHWRMILAASGIVAGIGLILCLTRKPQATDAAIPLGAQVQIMADTGETVNGQPVMRRHWFEVVKHNAEGGPVSGRTWTIVVNSRDGREDRYTLMPTEAKWTGD